MRLKTVAKLATIASVLLFCLALGCYVFMQLDRADRHRDVNLFSLVPSDCTGVLYSDNIYAFMDNYPEPNSRDELNRFQFPGLFEFILSGLKEYAGENAHGLSNQMGHLAVSFHDSPLSNNQVVYLRMEADDKQLLADMLNEFTSSDFLPKEEKYRGKKIRVYPLGDEDFLASYEGKGFWALSYQKRLIEEVIDASLDDTSLADDELFSRMQDKKRKSRHFMTLYTRSASMPFLAQREKCWSEYEFHLNSDVLYLTGEMLTPDEETNVEAVEQRIKEMEGVEEPFLIVSVDKDSTGTYVEKALSIAENGDRTLFNECVANLSTDASFTLAVDMETVAREPQRFREYLPEFVINHKDLFIPFVLSVQLTLGEGHVSHIWVFTYKD